MAANDQPLKHIIRTGLPWREATKTVCGKPVTQYAPGLVISIEEARTLVRQYGQQRAAFLMCMTCINHVSNWTTWERDPVARMARECERGWGDPDPLVVAELRAIGILVERYRVDFDEVVAGIVAGDVVQFSDLRKQRDQRGTA